MVSPVPEHGWTCFHCGETFTTPGSAEDHFGARPTDVPGCVLKVQLGGERGMLMTLRKAQAENASLHEEINDNIWNDKAFHARLEIMLQSYRVFRKCSTIRDVFNLYDSMEGRALAAEERADASEKSLAKYGPAHEYRLSDADLNRLVNACGSGNDLAWAIKDLLCLHYEAGGLREEVKTLTAKTGVSLEHRVNPV